MNYVFDIDGTLTPSSLPMDKDFEKFFYAHPHLPRGRELSAYNNFEKSTGNAPLSNSVNQSPKRSLIYRHYCDIER